MEGKQAKIRALSRKTKERGYREGYNMQWAYEIPKRDFSNLNDSSKTIEDFLKYIHVVNIPEIQRGLDEQY